MLNYFQSKQKKLIARHMNMGLAISLDLFKILYNDSLPW